LDEEEFSDYTELMKTVFIVWILILASLLTLVIAFGQYIDLQKHNLNVVQSVRLCGNGDLHGEQVKKCADYTKRTAIFFSF
jgi:uncharacterized ion transporter superfamily protein YfcC